MRIDSLSPSSLSFLMTSTCFRRLLHVFRCICSIVDDRTTGGGHWWFEIIGVVITQRPTALESVMSLERKHLWNMEGLARIVWRMKQGMNNLVMGLLENRGSHENGKKREEWREKEEEVEHAELEMKVWTERGIYVKKEKLFRCFLFSFSFSFFNLTNNGVKVEKFWPKVLFSNFLIYLVRFYILVLLTSSQNHFFV